MLPEIAQSGLQVPRYCRKQSHHKLDRRMGSTILFHCRHNTLAAFRQFHG